jgi:hypothetical protein
MEHELMPHSFADALQANGPAADRAARMDLYAWLIGSWTFDAVVHLDNGARHDGKGEIHFAWVLEGRAIQDVWILPGLFHGTTLRVYDPTRDAWHIIWSDPLRQVYRRQIGRAHGSEILQEGRDDAGVLMRWRFVDIDATKNSFRWLGERAPDGQTWQRQAEFWARRVVSV